MKKINVENWYKHSESRKLDEQVKGFIADTVEGYLNGIYDCGYKAMTKKEWKQYVVESLNREIEAGIIVNGIERKHMRFAGNKKFSDLIDTYLDNYSGVQSHII